MKKGMLAIVMFVMVAQPVLADGYVSDDSDVYTFRGVNRVEVVEENTEATTSKSAPAPQPAPRKVLQPAPRPASREVLRPVSQPASQPASRPTKVMKKPVEPVEVKVEKKASEEQSFANLSLGFSIPATMVASENFSVLGSLEAQLVLTLRVVGDLQLRLEAGPGIGVIRQESMENVMTQYPQLTLTEFAGLELALNHNISIAVGGRHRVAFWAEGARLNALLLEAQCWVAVLPQYMNLRMAIFGAIGAGWYPVVKKSNLLYPAGYEAPRYTVVGTGPVVSLGLKMEYGL